MYPSIGVVVPTRNRPGLLRAALAAIAAQDYPGTVRTVVVYDQSPPDPTLGVEVLTPPSSVAVLAQGYQPLLHPSAG